MSQVFIPLKDVFRALLDGWIVKSGDLYYRIDEHGHLQSRYKEGEWAEITEPLNKVTFMGTEEDLKEMQNKEKEQKKEKENSKWDGKRDDKKEAGIDWKF